MSGRTAPRSRTGCSTCRTRKVKCDEERPCCSRCRSAQLSCDWVRPPRRQRPKPAKPDRLAALQVVQQRRVLLPRDAFGLSTSQQLRNSLRLSSMDREYLVYFPNTIVVAWVGKPWKWGLLRYLYSSVASESPVVMRLMLALSASELETRRSMDPDRIRWSLPCQPGTGVAHYSAALREFRSELERSRRQPLSQEKLDEIIAAFFFLISYEHHFGGGWSGLNTHLSGMYAFLKSCGVLGDLSSKPEVDMAVSSKNLLLYIMYIALSHAWGGTDERETWLRAMDNDTFCDFIDCLFLESRDTNSIIFRGEYPTEELADDISVYHPLDFFHECSKLKHRLLSYIRDVKDGKEPETSTKFLLSELKRIGKRFRNLVMLGQREDPPIRLRELQTIYSVVGEYHALEIVCHRAICIPQAGGRRPACHRDALANVLGVCRKMMKRNPRVMVRLIWPLVVAAESVDDADDKRWIQETVETVRRDTGSSSWLAEGLDDIWASPACPQQLTGSLSPRIPRAGTISAISDV